MRVAWHNTPSISSSSPVSRYLGSGSFQRRLPRQRQPDFIVATGGGKAREHRDRESFFYPCSPKNLPKETPFLRPTTFKLFPPSPSLSPQKEPLFDARKSRANIRDGFSPVKSASRFFFSPRSRALLSFFQSGTLQVFLLSLPFSPHLLPRPPVFQSSAMNLPLSLVPFLQALFTCFRPGYKCPRVSGLQVVSATRNHCPLAVRFRGGRGGLSRGAACGE